MKTIMLMRHAQSLRRADKDVDRPLTEQGTVDASQMGLFVRKAGVLPLHIESSTAKRAQQTARAFVKAAGVSSDMISLNDELYFGGARNYVLTMQKAPAEVNHLMLIGHNPLLEETVSLLCNGEGAYVARIPEGGLVCIEHPAIKWEQLKPGTARFRWMMIPELLPAADIN